ncbi:hypothetical protein NM688_g5335 [Phlebia brevispora]|uniref:Uncharacterized protein n=1 Tax=Phlebia brevispora TaxID=194682 RepID=A0ACC1SXA4_9APHY|nr:hypothetical protein NM688_g5335 [Phlebia brevispora]
MGVPALFRWLSKKYPKIVNAVVEEEESSIPDESGDLVTVPVDISKPNPNGVEFDNLYLDMNGIVHPCTHPEGKPPPETEEEMMVEIFKYTERVVNMVRPRKLLFMAIDGVAPRAKMNQQRSRRFRAAQEAKDKEEARKEAIQMWHDMGKVLSEEEQNKKTWDSNAITPGTPFMQLLAASLRYWVAQKLNTDPGWRKLKVIISDAGVPGEGEHKIMDFIRRQRTNPGHDPNTQHVIYGLDADLIMLALATHEPHFRVLREDVFAQSDKNACRICGQEGHYAAQCDGVKPDTPLKGPPEKKPFIFLDVAVLREYLEAELNTANVSFPFNLEQAIDDWVLLIFFVGNDFLPHLPSLEIREGAIDTLLKIWKEHLPRMGGYITNNGQLELSRAQIILEGLAKRESEIFRRRREAEERQDANAKRRKIGNGDKPGQSDVPTPSSQSSLPPRPAGNAKADSIGLGGPKTAETEMMAPTAVQALAGSNRDVVANRRFIRMANMSAAEVLKAELASLVPVKKSAKSLQSSSTPAQPAAVKAESLDDDDSEVPGLGGAGPSVSEPSVNMQDETDDHVKVDDSMDTEPPEGSPHGVKRKLEVLEEEDAEVEETIEDTVEIDEEDEAPSDVEKPTQYALKVNPDGTVEQEDTVKLWESGYEERYYAQKFGVHHDNIEFRKEITKKYIEGMAWVLQYYYQGTPSWKWFYPYHFAPFAADFTDIASLDLKFELGQPFKPFEQLMGVFPASSRTHIPEVFHPLMTEDDSPIIDFYPETFEIDMNGKRMAWQGVALLPFIEEKRLLDAMAPRYPGLTEEERKRNAWGNNVIFVYEECPLYHQLEALYGKRKSQDPVPIDVKSSEGMSGSLLPNPDCLPGSTYYSPLTTVDLPDIKGDRSLSALYFFPKQRTPHRSVLLPGVKRPPPILTESDRDMARFGRGRGRGRGYGGPDRGRNGGYTRGGPQYGGNGREYGDNQYQRQQNGRGGYSGDNSYEAQQGRYSSYQEYQQPHSYQQNGYGGRGGPPHNGHNSYDRGRGRGGPPRGQPGGYNSYNSNPYGSSNPAPYGGYGGQSYNQGGYGRGGGPQGGYGGGGQGGTRGTRGAMVVVEVDTEVTEVMAEVLVVTVAMEGISRVEVTTAPTIMVTLAVVTTAHIEGEDGAVDGKVLLLFGVVNGQLTWMYSFDNSTHSIYSV